MVFIVERRHRAHDRPTKLEQECARYGVDPIRAIKQALEDTPTLQEAAERLGVSRNTLHRYMKRYNMGVK
jgi:transcriptional regulator of acetoin/glycerol metabolism